jgi:NitT/TauT family transport system permease protein
MKRLADILPPLLLGIALLGLWEWIVAARQIPPYVLPAPSAIARAFTENFPSLMASLLATLSVTVQAFLVALIAGVATAILFSQSRLAERTLYPYAVILQVTPVVAIAPLILIWVGFDRINAALVLIAALVAFFPILSNTILGLRSVDPNLQSLFELYGAGRWRTLIELRLPSALPYFLGGLRISGGLALIGAVVAEFVAGTGGSGSGLAYRILESGYQLKIPRMFAALALISATGIVIFLLLTLLSHLLLRHWHESALAPER